ncbi:MAG: hypothetical protein QM500_19595 [Methylococcales bacterium]
MINVKSIEISGVEGVHAYCALFPMSFSDLASADAMLKKCEQYNGAGSYKHRVLITFEDGEQYQADMCVQGQKDTDIKAHITEYLNAVLGLESIYKGVAPGSEEDKAEIRQWLETYNLN